MKRVRAAGSAPRTVLNVYGVCRSMVRDATTAGHIRDGAAPCTLRSSVLGTKRDADPEGRDGAVLAREEVGGLISDERVPEERRFL